MKRNHLAIAALMAFSGSAGFLSGTSHAFSGAVSVQPPLATSASTPLSGPHMAGHLATVTVQALDGQTGVSRAFDHEVGAADIPLETLGNLAISGRLERNICR